MDYDDPVFCTVEDIEAFLQIDIPAGAKTVSAERAIAEASAAIRGYCRQYLSLVEGEVLALDWDNGAIILLPELPVVEVTEVVEDGETLVDQDDYKLGQYGKLYRMGRGWTSGVQVLEITYTHGYADIPQAIVDVCTRSAARAYQAGLRADQQDGQPGVQGETLGAHSVQYGTESAGAETMLGASGARMLLLSEKDELDRYRV